MIKKIDKGYSFSLGLRAIGFILLFLSLFILIGDLYILLSSYSFSWFLFILGSVIFTVGALFSFSKEYLIIDYKAKQILNVLNVLGVKWRKKNDLSLFKHISVISRRFKYDREYLDESSLAIPSFNDYVYKHHLVFLTPRHLGQLLISEFDDYDEAVELGKVVSKYTGMPLVRYAPKRLTKRR